MKIRSAYELESALDSDLAWRRKEFTTIRFMIASARQHEKLILTRSGIALLYAHWEGHIKKSAEVYICYLNFKAHKYSEMKDNFVQLSLSDKFAQGFSIKKFPSQKEIFEYITGELSENFNVDEKKVIDTESNLKYSVLYNMLGQLGLDSEPFELKEKFIDSKMLKNRNSIAHGDRVKDKDLEDTYNELEKDLLEMIITFQNMIRIAVSNEEYLK